MKEPQKNKDVVSKFGLVLFILGCISLVLSVGYGIYLMMNYEEQLAEKNAMIEDMGDILNEKY